MIFWQCAPPVQATRRRLLWLQLPFSAAALQFNNRLASMDKLSAAGLTFLRSFSAFTSALCQRFLRLGCGRLTENSLVPGNQFCDLLVQSVNWISILQGNARLILHPPHMNAIKIAKNYPPSYPLFWNFVSCIYPSQTNSGARNCRAFRGTLECYRPHSSFLRPPGNIVHGS